MILPPQGFEGWKVIDDRRRHRLDQAGAGRHAARHQSRSPASSASRRGRPTTPTRWRWTRSRHNAIFTNVALTDDGDVWWEGMDDPQPSHAIDWKGNDWTPDMDQPAAHPECALHRAGRPGPDDRSGLGRPAGRADRAFIFGGRLSKTFPLVYEARNWKHGVFMAATMGSEATAAAIGQAAIRRDPFAMLPFIGYNMADYWAHWLSMEAQGLQAAADLPRQLVPQGRERQVHLARLRREHAGAEVDRRPGQRPGRRRREPVRLMPRYEDITWAGLDFTKEKYHGIMDINRQGLLAEAAEIRQFFDKFGEPSAGRTGAATQGSRRAGRRCAGSVEDGRLVSPLSRRKAGLRAGFFIERKHGFG